MTITYPLSFPSVSGSGFSAFSIDIREANTSQQSPYDFSQQVYQYQGQIWEVSATLTPMLRADAAYFDAFFLKLRGKVGTFLMGDPVGKTPRGTWAGTARVNGATQTGNTLIIDGLSAGATVKAGDYFQLGSGSSSRLFKLTADGTADGSGNLTLEFQPEIINAPADNDTLTTTSAVGLFRMTDTAVPAQIDSRGVITFAFKAVGVP